jgi:hypothetical protein
MEYEGGPDGIWRKSIEVSREEGNLGEKKNLEIN